MSDNCTKMESSIEINSTNKPSIRMMDATEQKISEAKKIKIETARIAYEDLLMDFFFFFSGLEDSSIQYKAQSMVEMSMKGKLIENKILDSS